MRDGSEFVGVVLRSEQGKGLVKEEAGRSWGLSSSVFAVLVT